MSGTIMALNEKYQHVRGELKRARARIDELEAALASPSPPKEAAQDMVSVPRAVLLSARETILDLVNSRWSEAEGTEADWVGDIDAALAASPSAVDVPREGDLAQARADCEEYERMSAADHRVIMQQAADLAQARAAAIEEAAKVAEEQINPGFFARDQRARNHCAEEIAAAIRALASRPVSEREGGADLETRFWPNKQCEAKAECAQAQICLDPWRCACAEASP